MFTGTTAIYQDNYKVPVNGTLRDNKFDLLRIGSQLLVIGWATLLQARLKQLNIKVSL